VNKSDEFKVCSREPKPWKGEAFWRKVDKFMEIFDHRAYWYVCLGMILVGTILGVIAQYLK
jgi:hypothetical protein